MVPHITDAIQDWIQRVAARPVDGNSGVPHVCVIELGGTVRRKGAGWGGCWGVVDTSPN